MMTADDIFQAIIRHHRDAAVVHEVVIGDDGWLDQYDDERPGQPLIRTRRIDALMFKSLERTAVEIKISKADFARDTYAKRRPWQRVVHRFIYAVPHDLEVMSPHGCGLWLVHPDGRITIGKKAIVNRTPESLPQHVVQALAYRAMRAGREAP